MIGGDVKHNLIVDC